MKGSGGRLEIVRGIWALSRSPAVFLPRSDIVVVADVHLGYESALARTGVFLPMVQLRKAVELIKRAREETGASRLVINGDIKHVFEKLTRQEKLEVPKLVREAFDAGFREVIVVRGNHDNYVSGILKSLGVEFVEERLDLGSGITVTHGHKDVRGFDFAILGHEHPATNVSIGGSKIKLPVYLSVPMKDGSRALVLPPIGAYQAGNDVSLHRDNYLSPMIKERGVVEDAVPLIYDDKLGVIPLARLAELVDLTA